MGQDFFNRGRWASEKSPYHGWSDKEARTFLDELLFTIRPDGTGETQITDTPGLNGFPKWGRIRSAVPAKQRRSSRR